MDIRLDLLSLSCIYVFNNKHLKGDRTYLFNKDTTNFSRDKSQKVFHQVQWITWQSQCYFPKGLQHENGCLYRTELLAYLYLNYIIFKIVIQNSVCVRDLCLTSEGNITSREREGSNSCSCKGSNSRVVIIFWLSPSIRLKCSAYGKVIK